MRSVRFSSASRCREKQKLRANELISPLRDLFAAMFFLFFSFQIDPADLVAVIGPAIALALVTVFTKVATGWYAAGRMGVGPKARMRAGTVLIARGEFSIVIAALGSSLVDGPDLGALAAGYVLITAVVGPTRLEVLRPDPDSRPARRPTCSVQGLTRRLVTPVPGTGVTGQRISKTGCLGAAARSSSSVASGPTPSKNWPTSHFQRRR